MDRIAQTIYLKPNVKEALDDVSKKIGVSQSNLTNQALIEYLDNEIKRLEDQE